ncbi:TlpA disulfide reductase family protein [Paenibacillus filicis]|uniref:TlpA disulfide reductase family protein n=1 Tax=Paenibacillus filicis TaxID=669464 RepID=A0ABU9DFL1_9BACL
MKKGMLAILFIAGLVVYGGYDYYSKSAMDTGKAVEAGDLETGTQKGQLAPDFVLNDLKGNPVHLSDLEGKTVLVNFWATWCPPCRVEMPHMQKFYEDYTAKDVVIVGVNLTHTEEKRDKIQTFVDDQQLTFPIVMDLDGSVTQQYQVVAYPTTYLLDARGVIREKFRGAINYEIMKDAVSKLR